MVESKGSPSLSALPCQTTRARPASRRSTPSHPRSAQSSSSRQARQSVRVRPHLVPGSTVLIQERKMAARSQFFLASCP